MDREVQENEGTSAGRRKRRGPYKKYIEPGQPLNIPKETKRMWAKKAKLCEENCSNAGDAHNQTGPESINVPSTYGGGSSLSSSNLPSSDDEQDALSAEEFEDGSPSDSADGLSDTSDGQNEEFSDHTDDDVQQCTETNAAEGIESAEALPVFMCHGGCVCGSCTTQDSEDDEPTSAGKMSEKYELDKTIHPALKCTKFEVFLMVFLLFVRHKLTYALVEDLLKMINTIVGTAVLKTSEYIFRKMFRPNCKVFTHFYCLKCDYYLGEISTFKGHSKVNCICGESCNVQRLKGNYFVTLSIADSIKHYFSRSNVNLMPSTPRLDGVYSDVVDGDLYKEKIESEIRKGKNVLTLTINTDGARVFKSRGGSMWPIQFIINEINPEDRFKDENVFFVWDVVW